MISRVISFASENPYIFVPLAVLGTIVIISGISDLAIPILKNLGSKFYNSTVVLNIRSFFCRSCADKHKFHIAEDERIKELTKKFKDEKANKALDEMKKTSEKKEVEFS